MILRARPHKSKNTKIIVIIFYFMTLFSQQIGINKIAIMMKNGCKRVGLEITGHGVRWISITTLVNDSAVNMEESLAFARHTSVDAQRPYMMRDAHGNELIQGTRVGL